MCSVPIFSFTQKRTSGEAHDVMMSLSAREEMRMESRSAMQSSQRIWTCSSFGRRKNAAKKELLSSVSRSGSWLPSYVLAIRRQNLARTSPPHTPDRRDQPGLEALRRPANTWSLPRAYPLRLPKLLQAQHRPGQNAARREPPGHTTTRARRSTMAQQRNASPHSAKVMFADKRLRDVARRQRRLRWERSGGCVTSNDSCSGKRF